MSLIFQYIKFLINKFKSAKLVRKGSCRRCGNCCRNIILSITENEPIRTEKQFEETKQWDKFFNNFYISGSDASGVLLFTCREIDENNRCRVYPFRGLGCRMYPKPNVKFLINGGEMLEGCGYYFEPDKSFRSFLK